MSPIPLFEPVSATESLFTMGVPLALVFLAITGALLVADLKRPERFLWVILRPQWKSWLVRGAYIISAYGALLSGWFLLGGTPGGFWSTLGGLLAAATAAYSGWLFGQAKGRDLWQSPLVPVHLLVQAFVAGCAALLIIDPREFIFLAPWLGLAIGVDAGLILVELHGRMRARPPRARAS
jgi:formate-dependent nitrite reductase membrane component NrfD